MNAPLLNNAASSLQDRITEKMKAMTLDMISEEEFAENYSKALDYFLNGSSALRKITTRQDGVDVWIDNPKHNPAECEGTLANMIYKEVRERGSKLLVEALNSPDYTELWKRDGKGGEIVKTVLQQILTENADVFVAALTHGGMVSVLSRITQDLRSAGMNIPYRGY
jgi:hypothetical protein